MSSQLFIHIGYPKAASSTLQMNLFSKHPEINYLLGPTENHNWREALPLQEAVEFWQNLTFSRELTHDKLYQALTLSYQNSIHPYIKSDFVNVISFEHFTSPWIVDNKSTASRLKYFFSDAKIIIMLRNQFDILESLYRYRPKAPLEPWNQNSSYLSFQEWMVHNFNNYDRSFLVALDFYEMVMLYSHHFGKENVGIFLFEDLVYETDMFVAQISDFMELENQEIVKQLLKLQKPRNQGQSSQYLALRSKIFPKLSLSSKLPKGIFNALKEVVQTIYKTQKKLELTDEQQKKVFSLFGTSNKKLAIDFSLDLKKYNYPL